MIRLLALLLLVTPAAAANMSFFIANDRSFDVAMELYGARPDRVWPGNDKVYAIDKGARKSLPVECNAGERICYGAWRVGDDTVVFGSGPGKAFACSDCCFICVDKTTSTIRFGE